MRCTAVSRAQRSVASAMSQLACGPGLFENLALGGREQRYAIIGQLGSGTFGRVRTAIDRFSNRRVAVKVQRSRSEEAERELLFYSFLQLHPHGNVVGMLDYFCSISASSKTPLLQTVHELCATSLWEAFKTEKCGLDLTRLRRYLMGAASGVGHIHKHGFTHGDLALKNVLLDFEDNVKIADFGSAFHTHGLLALDGDFATRYVSAPEEVLASQVPLSSAVDMWALGIDFFCLRFGQCPWLKEGSLFEMLAEQTRWFGPIIEETWPDHASCKKWAEFSSKHEQVIDQPMFCDRVKCLMPTYIGPAPQSDEVEVLEGLLAVCPERRWTSTRLMCCAFVASSQTTAAGRGPRKALDAPDVAQALTDEAPDGRGPDGREPPAPASSTPPASSMPPPPPPPPLPPPPPPLLALADRLVGEAALASEASSSRRVRRRGSGTPPGSQAQSPATGPEPSDTCECQSGNCGFRLCRRRAYSKAGVGCSFPKLPGRKFCFRCKCECHECQRPRNSAYGKGRWCYTHRELGTMGGLLNPVNGLAVFEKGDAIRAPRGWNWQLRCTQHMAFILPMMNPEDLVALTELGPPGEPGALISAEWIGALFLAQTIKWPGAIRFFYNFLFAGGDHGSGDILPPVGHTPVGRFRGLSLTAKVFVDAYMATLSWASGRSWGNVFTYMNFGLQDAQTGLAVNGLALGLLQYPSACVKRTRFENRAPAKAGDQRAQADDQREGTRLLLGPQSTEHILVPEGSQGYKDAVTIAEYILSHAQECKLVWPDKCSDVPRLADRLLDYARTVRRLQAGHHGFDGGNDPKHAYKAKSFTRAALLILRQVDATMFHKMKFADLQKWTPDQAKHCDSLSSLTVAEVESKLGVPALTASLWTCLVHAAEEAAAQLIMKTPPKDLLSTLDTQLEEYEAELERGSEHIGFMPQPKNWAALLSSGS